MSRHSSLPKTPEDTLLAQYASQAGIDSYRTVGLWTSEAHLIECYFEEGASVLDIGCGAGRTSIDLALRGYRVTAIDIVPEMVAAAREQGAAHGADVAWARMDAQSLQFDNAAFRHAFFSFNGFEHIARGEAGRRTLAEAYRVLEPGGYFILTARSGVGIGRRWVAWAWMLLRNLLLRPLRLYCGPLSLGEMVTRGGYLCYRSPFLIRRSLRDAGFQLVHFNSRRNIDRDRRAGFLTNFSPDISLFFVAQKPPSAGAERGGHGA